MELWVLDLVWCVCADSPLSSPAMSSIAARLEARAAEEDVGGAGRDNATLASQNHAARTAFLASFEAGRSQMERELAALASAKDKSNSASSSSSAETAPPLDPAAALRSLSSSLSSLHALSAASAHLLPAYELRANKTALRELEAGLDHARAQAQPRGKFKFTRRKPAATGNSEANAVKQAEAASETTAAAAAPAAAVPASASSSSTALDLPPEDPRTGFYRHSGRILVKLPSSIDGCDVTLSDLSDCIVLLLGSPTALRCSNLKRTSVWMGPCSGSVLIYGATDCAFHLAARQLRIHDAHTTSFRLHAKSAPIIEHTDTVGFGSYDLLSYPGMDQHWVESKLLLGPGGPDVARKQSKHGEVEDFNWLRAQHSPNWWSIPEEGQSAAHATDAASSTVSLPSIPPLTITPQQMAALRDMPDTDTNDAQLQRTLETLVAEWRLR